MIIDGVQFRDSTPVEFKAVADKYHHVAISNTDGFEFELTIVKPDDLPLETSVREAKSEASDFADRLALIENHDVKSLNYIGYVDKNGKLINESKVVTVRTGHTSVVMNPHDYYAKTDIKGILVNEKRSELKRIHRTAVGINDPISQYLIFYGLLQILEGDKQKEVDNYIRSKVEDIPDVQGKNGSETIITSIRNMIGHPKDSLELTELYDLVEKYLDTLRELVTNILRKE